MNRKGLLKLLLKTRKESLLSQIKKEGRLEKLVHSKKRQFQSRA